MSTWSVCSSIDMTKIWLHTISVCATCRTNLKENVSMINGLDKKNNEFLQTTLSKQSNLRLFNQISKSSLYTCRRQSQYM